jgi:hypothetical protein
MYEKLNLEGQNLGCNGWARYIFLIPMLFVVFKNLSHLDTPLTQPLVIDESFFGVIAYIEKTNEGFIEIRIVLLK